MSSRWFCFGGDHGIPDVARSTGVLCHVQPGYHLWPCGRVFSETKILGGRSRRPGLQNRYANVFS